MSKNVTTFWQWAIPKFVYDDAARREKSLAIARGVYERRFGCAAPEPQARPNTLGVVNLLFPLPTDAQTTQLSMFEVGQ